MKNILCFGDSNTWGYDYTTYDPALGAGRRMAFDERWPGIVQLNLGSEYRIIEDALNARRRLRWMLRLLWIWSSSSWVSTSSSTCLTSPPA